MKATGRALIGVVLCAIATFGYFAWWARRPDVGELEWPIWLVEAAGLSVALRAVLRPPVGALRADRIVAGVCLALAVGLAGLLGAFTRDSVYRLPSADAARVAPGRTLPDLALVTSEGETLSLAKEQREGRFAGRKLIVAFFRGYW